MENCSAASAQHGSTSCFLAESEAFKVALVWMVVMKSQDYKFPEPCDMVTMKES